MNIWKVQFVPNYGSSCHPMMLLLPKAIDELPESGFLSSAASQWWIYILGAMMLELFCGPTTYKIIN